MLKISSRFLTDKALIPHLDRSGFSLTSKNLTERRFLCQKQKKPAQRLRPQRKRLRAGAATAVTAKIKPAPGKSKAEPKPIKSVVLGGLNEVGKNMTLFEYGEDMFLVDCGLAFRIRICSESISCFPISPMSSATRTGYAE